MNVRRWEATPPPRKQPARPQEKPLLDEAFVLNALKHDMDAVNQITDHLYREGKL